MVAGFPGNEPATVGDLAERLQIRHHSAVGLVDRLVADGLMRRILTPEDKRKVRLALTEEGLDALDALSAVHRDELRRSAPRLVALLHTIAPPLGETPGQPH